jgi:aminoglycoside phosphotransferase (APT) family kinase protein
VPIGLDRWFDTLQDLIDAGATGFVAARRWLVDNQPTDRPTNVICHGDLHPGNILVDGDLHVTAALDWTVATLAEPALELGFTAMAFSLVPLDGPSVVQLLARRVGLGISRRYVRAYLARNLVDVSTQPYYEALRCAMELGGVARWRLAVAAGRGAELLRPTWDSIGDVMVDYFRARTGVELTLPPAVQVVQEET